MWSSRKRYHPCYDSRIPIYEWTNPARVIELADDAALALDIRAFIFPKIIPRAMDQSPLPERIRASIYSENAHLVFPLMVSCGTRAGVSPVSYTHLTLPTN